MVRRSWRSGAAVMAALAALAVGVSGCSVAEWFTAKDAARLDRVATELTDSRASYARASDRVRALARQSPDTTRVSLTSGLTCRTIAGARQCDPTTAADEQLMRSLKGEVAIWQVKDGDRVFYRFFGEDSPTIWLMDAPFGGDPNAFARDRGFRAVKVIDDRWTALGPIPDDARDREQWAG